MVTTALIAALAVAVLMLSWPRLQASVNYLPVKAAIKQYWLKRELPRDRLGELQQRTLRSAQLHDHPRYWGTLNLLYFLQAGLPENSLSERRLAFENSVEAANRALQLAPVQPRLWMRKAQALDWLSFRPGPAIDALKMSIYTGRVEPQLFMSRLQLGYAHLNVLDKEAQGLLADQTQLAWTMRNRDLMRALKSEALSHPSIEFLLWHSHPDLLTEIRRALGLDES